MRPIEMLPLNEGDQAVLLARLEDNDGAPLLQANISAINVRSYNVEDAANVVVSDDPSVASTIFDTLQEWPVIAGFTAPDDEGYNFKYVTPATFFPQGKSVYQVEAKITLSSGVVRTQIWRQPTTNLFQR